MLLLLACICVPLAIAELPIDMKHGDGEGMIYNYQAMEFGEVCFLSLFEAFCTL